MVHTFELSKMISKEMFDTVIGSLKMRCFHGCWVAKDYADKGFSLIRLYKLKREEARADENILSFTPAFVRAVYHNIFELIPCLEIHPEWCIDSCWEEASDNEPDVPDSEEILKMMDEEADIKEPERRQGYVREHTA